MRRVAVLLLVLIGWMSACYASTRTVAVFDLNNFEDWTYTGSYEVNRDNISHLYMNLYGSKVLESPELNLEGLDSISVNVAYAAKSSGYAARKLALTYTLKGADDAQLASVTVPAVAGLVEQEMVAVLPVTANAARLVLAALKADLDDCAAVRSVTITGYFNAIQGDVNGDGSVDVSDINEIVNCITGESQSKGADVNGDGVVDISDVNLVINLMLGA